MHTQHFVQQYMCCQVNLTTVGSWIRSNVVAAYRSVGIVEVVSSVPPCSLLSQHQTSMIYVIEQINIY